MTIDAGTAQKGEREVALAALRDIADTSKAWDSMLAVRIRQLAEDATRALLSSAAAEAEMREALEKIEAYTEELGSREIARAALSKEPEPGNS
jgi:hypothetical protein